MPHVQRSVSTLHTVTSQAWISIFTSAFPIQPVLLGVNKKCHWWLFVEKAQLLFLLLCNQNCPILDPDISKGRDEKYAQCRVEWRFFVQRFPAARSLIQWRGRARRQLSSRMRRRGRTRRGGRNTKEIIIQWRIGRRRCQTMARGSHKRMTLLAHMQAGELSNTQRHWKDTQLRDTEQHAETQ